MSSAKTFVGNAAAALREADKLSAYTKVTVTDGDKRYSAGSDGRELVVTVPVLPTTEGETLAANLLAAVKGYRYQPYEADSALLDPAAELGDGVTVGGVYGGIHARSVTFSRLFRANVSAPAEEEIDNEYPYLSAQERDAARQKKQTAKNTADIAANTSDIKTNASGIAANATAITTIEAAVADFGTVYAKKVDVESLSANVANITSLFTNNAYTGAVNSTEVATKTLRVGGTTYSQKTVQFQDKTGKWNTFTVLGNG